MSKAVVLLSGGQDSTTSLYWARERIPQLTEIHALTLSYGQRHESEIAAASRIAKLAGCTSHVVMSVPVFARGESALIDHTKPLKTDGGLRDRESPSGLPTSFVPGRNMVFLAMAAAYAGSLRASHIVTGVCQTDYSGYPDCREDFIDAMQVAIRQAWPSREPFPCIDTPLMHLTKRQTVELARNLPGCWEALAHTISCYRGVHGNCDMCAACELRTRGFHEAGFEDPAVMRALADVDAYFAGDPPVE